MKKSINNSNAGVVQNYTDRGAYDAITAMQMGKNPQPISYVKNKIVTDMETVHDPKSSYAIHTIQVPVERTHSFRVTPGKEDTKTFLGGNGKWSSGGYMTKSQRKHYAKGFNSALAKNKSK